MKTMVVKRAMGVMIILSLSVSAMAQAYLQNPKFGEDEDTRRDCAVNLSLYREYYNQRNFDSAKEPWLKVLDICPRASQNAYIHGVRMMKDWIEKENDPNRKNELVDSLLWLYDMRIENFDRQGILTGQKGADLFTYNPDRYKEAYAFVEKSIELEGDNSETSILYTYMILTRTMYDNREITPEQVIDNYISISDMLDSKLKESPNDLRTGQIKEAVDGLFTSMNVINCDNIADIFGPRIEANPDDQELLEKTYTLLTSNRCNNTPFYRKIAEKVFILDPKSSLAYELARQFLNLKDMERTEKYFKEAIELEADSIRKSVYLVEYAGIVSREMNNPQRARSLALEALDVNPKMGHAYILIGNLYAAEKNCGSNALDKKAVFWAAVDKFIKAKQVDPSLAGECDRFIELYSQYFPEQKDIFFEDLTPGDSFQVGCWINERTTIRAQP